MSMKFKFTTKQLPEFFLSFSSVTTVFEICMCSSFLFISFDDSLSSIFCFCGTKNAKI